MSKAIQVSTKTLLLSALLFAAATGCGDDKVDSNDAPDAGDAGNATNPGDAGNAANRGDAGNTADAAQQSLPTGVAPAQSSLARVTTPAASNVAALGAANAKLAFDLYRGVTAANVGKNVVFSPYSVSTALAMTYEGARGTTESEMKTTLHYELDKPALHEAFNATDLALSSRGAGKVGADGSPFRLNVNNSIWAQQDYSILPSFLDVMAVNYGSSVFLTDFEKDAEASRKAINGWVSDKTERLIPELLAKGVIRSDTRFVLTNTVYFNAGWQEKFEKRSTAEAPFTIGNEGGATPRTVKSKLMNADLFVPYAAGEDYRAVALPYADDKLRFVAVLPAEGKFAAVETKLGGAWLDTLNTSWKQTRVEVSLPQLDIETNTSLAPQLKSLGMQAAFGDADFSGLTSGKVHIDEVIHQAVLKVFEEGTIAAAATAVIISETSAAISDEKIRFDRPFLFAIVDQPTGEVLFLGRVLDPTAK